MGKKKSISVQRIRDVFKSAVIMENDETYFALFGIENQSDVHYVMPVRTMLYNALTYSEQVDTMVSKRREEHENSSSTFLSSFTKDDKLKPVITVTIYWGDKPWDAPVTLRDMLADMDARLATLVDDCNINLFSIIDLVKIPEFKTELKQVVSVLNARNSGNEMNDLIATDEVYKHLDRDTARILSAFTSLKMPRKNKERSTICVKQLWKYRKKVKLKHE